MPAGVGENQKRFASLAGANNAGDGFASGENHPCRPRREGQRNPETLLKVQVGALLPRRLYPGKGGNAV